MIIKEIDMKWEVDYNNDVGANDEGFWEWWEVTDGERTFKADLEADANWLCELLNEHSA
jgi:hypothetical protein